MIAVEVRGAGSGRIRLQTITDATAKTLGGFVKDNVEPGATCTLTGGRATSPWPEPVTIISPAPS